MNTRPPDFFSIPKTALEETDHFGKLEDRAREAENIRQEYLESKKTGRLPGVMNPIPREAPDHPGPETGSHTESYSLLLKNALEEVDYLDLNLLLNLVLTELRTRESDQMKEDILTHSKKLSLNASLQEPPQGTDASPVPTLDW